MNGGTTNGALSITGIASDSTAAVNSNDGVSIAGDGTSYAAAAGGFNNLTISGTGGAAATGSQNRGVAVIGQVSMTASNNVNITGLAGAQTTAVPAGGDNSGVVIEGTSAAAKATVAATTGSISPIGARHFFEQGLEHRVGRQRDALAVAGRAAHAGGCAAGMHTARQPARQPQRGDRTGAPQPVHQAPPRAA